MLPRACVVRVLCVHDLGCTTLPRACHALGAHCLLCYLWRVCRALGAHCLLPVGPYSARCGPVVSPSPAHRGLSVQCKPLGSRPLQSHLSHLLRAASDALPQQDTDNWNAYSLTSTHTHTCIHMHSCAHACTHSKHLTACTWAHAACPCRWRLPSSTSMPWALRTWTSNPTTSTAHAPPPTPLPPRPGRASRSLGVHTRCVGVRVLICHCGCAQGVHVCLYVIVGAYAMVACACLGGASWSGVQR